jgi:hypothetical protein
VEAVRAELVSSVAKDGRRLEPSLPVFYAPATQLGKE